MGKRVLNKLRDFRIKLQAEIAEMESYGISTTKQKERLSKLTPVIQAQQSKPREMTLVNSNSG